MLFSVNYKSKRRDRADEIQCPVNQLGLLFPYIKENPSKRILVTTSLELSIEKIKEQADILQSIDANYTIQTNSLLYLLELRQAEYPCFLSFAAVDWEVFHNLCELGVTDIYIDGPLGFQMNTIARAKEKYPNLKIRVSPNFSINNSLNKTGKPNFFFIRPEDLPIYSEFIDVLDCTYSNNPEIKDVVFDIYKKGSFNFTLDNLIFDLQKAPNNLLIPDTFAEHRLNCGQKCKVPGKSCHLCDSCFNIIEISDKILKEENK